MEHKSRIFTADGSQFELVSDGAYAEIRDHNNGPYNVVCTGSAVEVYQKYLEYVQAILFRLPDVLCDTPLERFNMDYLPHEQDGPWSDQFGFDEPIAGTDTLVVETVDTPSRGLFHRRKKRS